MSNVLVLNMEENLITNAYQHVSDDDVLSIKHKYSRLALYKHVEGRNTTECKVMQVCDVIFSKYLALDAKHGDRQWPVTIKQLMRASEAFRDAVIRMTHTSPKKPRWRVQKAY